MDKIDKNLKKLSDKQRKKLLIAFEQLAVGNMHGLDIKKMKGSKELFRLR